MSIAHSTEQLEAVGEPAGAHPAAGSAAGPTEPDHAATTVDLRADRPPAFSQDDAESGVTSGSAQDSPGGSRPTFTITDAAASCSVSRKTITRKLPELAGHGAAKDDDGVWRIPVEALLAVGLHPGRSLTPSAAAPRPGPSPGAAPASPPTAPSQETITIPRDRWDDLRIRLARAEAEASERALALADARLALRALTAGPASDVRVPLPPGGQGTGEAGSAGSAPGTDVPPGTPGPGAAAAAPGAAFAMPAVAPGAAASSVPPMSGPPAATPAAPGAVPAAASTGPARAPVEAPVRTDDPVGAAAEVDRSTALVAARQEAARSGGYVPATAAPVRKRRWWHSK